MNTVNGHEITHVLTSVYANATIGNDKERRTLFSYSSEALDNDP